MTFYILVYPSELKEREFTIVPHATLADADKAMRELDPADGLPDIYRVQRMEWS